MHQVQGSTSGVAPLGLQDADLDLLDDDVDSLDSNGGDAADEEAENLLEEMRRLNRDAAAACEKVESSTVVNDKFESEVHRKLQANILDMINDVASGVVPEEAPSQRLPAQAEIEAQPGKQIIVCRQRCLSVNQPEPVNSEPA